MRFTRAGWTVLAIAVMVSTLLLAVYLDLVSLRTISEPAMLLGLSLAMAAGFQIATVLAAGKPEFVRLTFWVYVYLWGALAPLAQMVERSFYWPGSYGPSEWFHGMTVTAVGTAAWWVGYRWWCSKRLTRRPRQLSRKRTYLLAVAGVAATAAGVRLLGLDSFVSARDVISETIATLAGQDPAGSRLLRAGVSIPPVAALTFLLIGKRRDGWRSRLSGKLLVVALTVATVVVANPIANPRFWSASVVIALALVGARVDTPARVRVFAVGLVVGLLVVFPVADAFRYEGQAGELAVKFDRELLIHGDYDAFQQTMNGIDYVDRRGHTLGRQLAGPAVFFVPRQAWDGKPESTGPLVAAFAGYDYTNLSSPAWVDGYIDFGWLGVAGVGLALGAIAAVMDRALRGKTKGAVSLIAPLYVGYQIILLRGSLLSVVPFLAVWAVISFAATHRATTAVSRRVA